MTSDAPLLAVLGGGQLGRMLGLAALALGVDCRFLDPSPDAGAAAVGELVTGALDDAEAGRRLADGAAAVTYEWEGVPAATVDALVAGGAAVHPSARSLEVAQDRVTEKERFVALGIDVAAFAAVDDRAGLDAAVDRIGLPAVLKTRRGGYDGKGQHRLAGPGDLDSAWDALGDAGPLVLEELVPFDRELSVLAVRGTDGDVRIWPLVENHHVGGILRLSRAPAVVTPEIEATAQRYARALLDDLDHVGVLTVELFQVGDRLLANEIAPRVHNSGHWTIEGAVTSQFENHVRAVLGWPLGDPSARGVSAMVNCIGTLPDPAGVLAVPGAHVHRYGKAARRGRKVGHVTVTADDPDELERRLSSVRASLAADDG